YFPSQFLGWEISRKFMLSAFSDASSLEANKDKPRSAYKQTQEAIVKSLRETRKHLENPDGPLIVIAQSLGGQVISNYIWDAQNKRNGVWKKGDPDYLNPSADEEKFLAMETVRTLFTTGCNIPVFIAGSKHRLPFKKSKMHQQFKWENYYDRDDILGWPLQPLSQEYSQLVKDIEIDSGSFLERFTPGSHTEYWTDRDFVEPLIKEIGQLL
ncbi:MAG: hypothetical protein AAFY11_11095, partial [Cyanobacteria bacterium J06641_5]